MATNQTLVVGKLTAVDESQAAFNSVQNNIRKTTNQSKALNQQFRMLRGGAGQVGHQIQDIAVQLQMGTNAMIVFGQQGSQIASLFGPQGAILGAVLAVGAAIGVTMMNDVKKGTEAMEKLGEQISDLHEKTGRLSPAMLRFNAALRETRILNMTRDVEANSEALADTREELRLYRMNLEMLASLPGVNPENDKQYKATAEQIRILEVEEKRLAAQIDVTKENINLLAQGYQRSVQDRIKATNLSMQASHTELDRLAEAAEKKSKIADLEMKSRLAGIRNTMQINDSMLAEIKRVRDEEIKAFDEVDKARKLDFESRLAGVNNTISLANTELNAIVEAERKKQEAKKKTMELDKMVLSNSQQIVSGLIQNMDQQSGAYKALFALQQAMAIAQTIIQYETAIAQAKGQLGIFGLPYEQILRAQQVASVAIIAGQTLASFEGGGMTPNGPRAGGVDGRGGRMAILHPNEKITDMRKSGGDSQPVNISFNIQANDAAGFDELLVKRRGLIVNMVNKAVNNSGKRSIT